jgi:hypothetical protein
MTRNWAVEADVLVAGVAFANQGVSPQTIHDVPNRVRLCSNLYRYVNNRPSLSIDPTGLEHRSIEISYDGAEAERLGLRITDGVKKEVNRIFQTAVASFAPKGSTLEIIWANRSAEEIKKQKRGWSTTVAGVAVEPLPLYAGAEGFQAIVRYPNWGWTNGFADFSQSIRNSSIVRNGVQAYSVAPTIGFGGATREILEKGNTFRVHLFFQARFNPNPAVIGTEFDGQATIYRDGLRAAIDARAVGLGEADMPNLIASAIAHEIGHHSIGKQGNAEHKGDIGKLVDSPGIPAVSRGKNLAEFSIETQKIIVQELGYIK